MWLLSGTWVYRHGRTNIEFVAIDRSRKQIVVDPALDYNVTVGSLGKKSVCVFVLLFGCEMQLLSVCG